MSTQSNSIPYRYVPAQPQDPRVPAIYPHQQRVPSTSTASAYAYAQRQQQLANRQAQTQAQAQSHPSTGSTSYSPFIPSPIHSQPASQPRRPSPLTDRPHSIEELARIAGQDTYDRFADIKQDLRYAEVYLNEGKKDLAAGDLEWAFIHFARTATLVLQRIPTNSHYNEMKQGHRDTLAHNGNFCLERMSEIKPRLVDRYEQWRQRYPNAKVELDMPRVLSAMAVRDNEELALRAQASKLKRAATKDDAARREQAEGERRRQEELMRRDSQGSRQEDGGNRLDTSRQPQYDIAARQAYEDARRRQEDARRREAEETRRREEERAKKEEEADRRRREAEEEGRRREEEIARRKFEETQRQEQALRQEQEAASQRKKEELEYRRQKEETRRQELEATRHRELEGIAQRQRQAKAEAEAEIDAGRHSLRVQASMPVPIPIPIPTPILPPSSSPSSGSSTTIQTMTPKPQDGLPVLPLESPTREENIDPRIGRHHPQPQYAIPERATGRTKGFESPITTTSPPPKDRAANWLRMSEDQRRQGYTPSLQSMFSAAVTGPSLTGLLFSPNHPEGPSMRNMPTSPDRPPAHIRHMWEMAGYGSSQPDPPKPKPSQYDSRIVRPEQVREREETVFPTELKIVEVPQDVVPRFLDVAAVNTARNKETCGLLMGRVDKKQYRVFTLLIPRQRATPDTCTMEEEELVSQFAETRKMITLGWIHTHPTQSCFMSSLDLHTHASFQSMLPEFFAIVCAPKQVPNCGVFRLTDPPGLKTILKCEKEAAFHPHPEVPIYTDADKGHVVWSDKVALEIVDLRR